MTIKELYAEKKAQFVGRGYKTKPLGGKHYKMKGTEITILHYSVRNDQTGVFQSDTPVHYVHRMAIVIDGKAPGTELITRSWWAAK